MDDFRMAWPFLIPIVAIIGSFATAIIATLSRARVRELEIRERIAMIEKGLVPPPEVDPRGFDRAMGRYDLYRERAPRRHRSAGVTLIGVGFGLMILIGFTSGEPSVAIGVGGFLVVMGLAFFINSRFDRNHDTPASYGARPPAGPASPASPIDQRPQD